MTRWLLALLVFLAVAAPASAQRPAGQAVQQRPATPAAMTAMAEAVVLEDSLHDVNAQPHIRAWTDAGSKSGIAQVTGTPTAARFQPLPPVIIHALGNDDALWLHMRLVRPKGSHKAWLIEFPLPLLDAVTVYQQDEQGRWNDESAGDTLSVVSWPEAGRYPFFRLDLPAGQARDVYVRIRHITPLSIPVRLASEASHDHRIQVEYLLLGIVFGALILLIAACLAQGWVHRDAVYAWYAAYAAITTLAVAAYTGVAAHMLWSNSGIWADLSQGSLALLAGAAALLFVRHLSGIFSRYPRLDKTVKWLGLLGLMLAPGYAMLERSAALAVMGLYLTLAASLNVWISLLAWRRGDEVGRWMLAAYVPLALAVLLTLLRVFGWVSASWLTQYGVVIAMAIEVPLLLVALNIRSRERHGAAIREQALSSQDALTGLLAPHLFHDRLRQVVNRFKRDRESAAVIFIDLVNYQRIQDYHGRAVAEQSLLRSVIKLRRLLRDVDTVSRIGEARFGLIMEGVSSRAVVTDRAARLIASGLMPLKGLKPDVTLQFHTAAVLLKERMLPAGELTEALVDLLAGMSSRTRRPIRFLEPEVTHPIPLESDSQHDAYEEHDSSLPKPL